MARKPAVTQSAAIVVSEVEMPGLPGAVAALDSHNANQSAELAEREAEVRSIATRLGYQLPADATDPDLIQRDIAANMRRSVEACLEVGRGLMVLKSACGHGNFVARLDVLGLDRCVAAKFMHAATKFSNVSTSTHLTKAIGSQSKLFEMLVLDDEQIEELELNGQTGELTLDDVATMSVKELRAALREAKAKIDSKDAVAAKNQQTIQELQETIARTPAPTPEFLAEEALTHLDSEALQCAASITAGLRSKMTQAMVTIDKHGADRHIIEQACAAALGRIFAAARGLVADFGILPEDGEQIDASVAGDASWAAVNEALAAQNAAGEGNGKHDA